MPSINVKDQAFGAFVHNINQQRHIAEIANLLRQDQNFTRALEEVNKIREFVGTPENILGSEYTKHGEIAEQVEVGIRNARSYLHGGEQVATFEGVGRLAPEDYLVNGFDVQSKFYNGINNTLGKGIVGHLDKYPDFTSNDGFYHIPKDQFEVIEKILKGEQVEGLGNKSIAAIKANVAEIESRTGQSFTEVVKPGLSQYPEVQQGAIHKTLDTHEKDLNNQNSDIKKEINEAHQASLAEGLKATGVAAAVGASLSLGMGLYAHYKNGKNPFKGELNKEEWQTLGIDTAKGAALGGVTGAAVYGLTNYASLSAPFAAAVVSATKGLASLQRDYQQGNISLDEFTSMGLVLCSESAIVGLATAVGQTLIPIPVLGAVIGSLAGQMMLNLLGKDSGKTITAIKKEMDSFLVDLNDTYLQVVEKIKLEFKRLGDLTIVAFDFDLNISLLDRSVELAQAYGLSDDMILKNTAEIDDYFLS